MATITPTPVTLPGSITVPADGQNIVAADVVGPLQHIADGVAFLTALGMKSKTFTADGTWNSPANCGAIGFIWGYGGGGGGGGAGPSGATGAQSACGGGGGGGAAAARLVPYVLAPSTAYDVDVGAGGTGGAASTNGGVGADTEFDSGGIYFLGGGRGGSASTSPSASLRAHRGAPAQGEPPSAWWTSQATPAQVTDMIQTVFGAGGAAFNAVGANNSHEGNGSAEGFAAGAGAAFGATTGTHLGGGGGGGGGAGPGGNGGAAGAGGAGNDAGIGAAGTAGSAAAANSGAGGGGGGAGGQGSVSGGTAGAGGAGGSGKLIIYYFGDAT